MGNPKRKIRYPIVKELRSIRRLKHMQQLDVGIAAGYHWQSIGYWERGERMPSIPALEDWAQALGYRLKLYLEDAR